MKNTTSVKALSQKFSASNDASQLEPSRISSNERRASKRPQLPTISETNAHQGESASPRSAVPAVLENERRDNAADAKANSVRARTERGLWFFFLVVSVTYGYVISQGQILDEHVFSPKLADFSCFQNAKWTFQSVFCLGRETLLNCTAESAESVSKSTLCDALSQAFTSTKSACFWPTRKVDVNLCWQALPKRVAIIDVTARTEEPLVLAWHCEANNETTCNPPEPSDPGERYTYVTAVGPDKRLKLGQLWKGGDLQPKSWKLDFRTVVQRTDNVYRISHREIRNSTEFELSFSSDGAHSVELRAFFFNIIKDLSFVR